MGLSLTQVHLLHVGPMSRIVRILTDCGKDMDRKYHLKHWKNSFFKTCLIVYCSALKNQIYAVYDGDEIIATFQIRVRGGTLHFSKLAVSPSRSGRGIGGYCLRQLELLAKSAGASKLICEVYCKSLHALAFYRNHGFYPAGEAATLKYRELILEKPI